MTVAAKYVVRVEFEQDSQSYKVLADDEAALEAIAHAAVTASKSLNESSGSFNGTAAAAMDASAALNGTADGYHRTSNAADEHSTALGKSVRLLEQQVAIAQAFESGTLSQADAAKQLALTMSDGNEAVADMIVKEQELLRELERLEDGLRGVGDEVEDVEHQTARGTSGLQKFGLGVLTVNQSLEIAQKVLSGFSSAIGVAFSGFDRGSGFSDLSKQVGVAVEQLTAFDLAARATGVGSTEILVRAMRNISRNLAQAAEGTGGAADAFNQLGVEIFDASGRFREPLEVFSELETKLATIEDPAARVSLAMKAIGEEAGPATLSLISSAEGLSGFVEIAQNLGLVLDEASAQSLSDVSSQFVILEAAAQGATQQIALGMAPGLRVLGGALVGLIRDIGLSDGSLRTFGAELGESFEQAADRVREIASQFEGADFETRVEAALSGLVRLGTSVGTRMGLEIGRAAIPAIGLGLARFVQDHPLDAAAAGVAATIGTALGGATGTAIGVVIASALVESSAQAFASSGPELNRILERTIDVDRFRDRITSAGAAALSGQADEARRVFHELQRDLSAAQDAFQQAAAEGITLNVQEGQLQILEQQLSQLTEVLLRSGVSLEELGTAANPVADLFSSLGGAFDGAANAAGGLGAKTEQLRSALEQQLSTTTVSNDQLLITASTLEAAAAAGLHLEEAERRVTLALIEYNAQQILADTKSTELTEEYRQQATATLELETRVASARDRFGDLGSATDALRSQLDGLNDSIRVAEEWQQVFDQATESGASFAEATAEADAASARFALQLSVEADGASVLSESILIAHDRLRDLNAEKQRTATLSGLREENDALAFQTQLLNQVTAGAISRSDAERAVAVHMKEQELLAGGVTENVHALALESVAIAEQFDAATEAVERMNDSTINLGDSFREGMIASLDAVISDTRKFSEVWEGIGISVLKDFAAGFLESKGALLDIPVETNFLQLGQTLYDSLVGNGTSALSDLGDLFSGSSSANGTASSGGGLGNLLPGGGGDLTTTTFSDPHLLPGEEIIGSQQLPDGSPGVLVRDSLGNEKVVPKDVSTTFNAGNAATSFGAGAVGGFGGAQFGNQFIDDTSLPSFLGSFERDILDRAHTINEILSTIVGGATGLAGGGALGGGVVGILSSVFGDMLLSDLSLRDFENGQFSNSLLPALGTLFAGPFAFSGAGNDFFNSLGFDLLGLPRTRGGAIREGLEPFLNESEALQQFLPAFNFNRFSGQQVGDALHPGGDGSINRIIADRGIDPGTFTQIRGMGEALFGDIGRELEDEQLGDTAFNAGLMFAETFTQGVERGMDDAEILEASTAALRAFAQEQGVTFQSAIERASHLQEAFKELGRVDGSPGNAEQEGFDAFGRSIAGAIEIFENDFPAGTQVGLVALQTLARDGEAAFADLTQAEKDAVLSMMGDFESAAELFAELSSRGFEIDLTSFDDMVRSASQSAAFVGENFSSSLQAANGNVDLFVSDITKKLGALASDTLLGGALDQLFDKTAIGQSFQPVFDALNQIGEFDLTSATGIADFRGILLPALAAGKANIGEYKDSVREILKLLREADEEIADLFAPSDAEKAVAVVESAFGNLGGAASSAIETGLAVLESTDSYDRGLAAFTASFVVGAEKNLKQAVLNALIDTAILGPIIERFQPAFSFIVAAGMEHGFNDPRVQAAWQQQLGLLRSDVEGAAPLIFDANLQFATADGANFYDALVLEVERAEGEIRGVFGNAVGAGLAEIEKVIADGGRTRSAIAKGSKVFAEAFGDSIQESTTSAITSAITQGVVLEGRLAPLLAELRLKTAAALDDGVITAAERADLSALGGKIVAEGHRAAGELTPVFQDIGLISLDVQNLDEVSKHAERLARRHKLLPADVEQFLRAAEGVDPDALQEFFDLLADSERPFREAAEKFRDVNDAVDEGTLIAFFKAADGVDPAKLTSYFDALTTHEESLRNASIWFAEITGVDQETLLGFFRAAQGVDPDALTAYFQALDSRDAAEAQAAERRATSFADLQDAAVGLVSDMGTATTATAELAFAASTAAAELSQIGGVTTATVGGIPGNATGGSHGAGGMAVVGEAGEPELVVTNDRGGFDVIPLDRATAAALMGDGVPGFATGGSVGGSVPSTGSGSLIVSSEFDRLRAENLRLKRQVASSSGSGGSNEPDLLGSFNFSTAIGKFALEGVAEFSPFVKEEIGTSVFEGIQQGFQEGEQFKRIMRPVQEELTTAMADGILSVAEAEELKRLGLAARNEMTVAIRGMDEAFGIVADGFGIKLQAEIEEIVDPLLEKQAAFAGGLTSSLRDVVNQDLGFDAFTARVGNGLFEHASSGLLDAFLQTGVFSAALQPVFRLIDRGIGAAVVGNFEKAGDAFEKAAIKFDLFRDNPELEDFFENTVFPFYDELSNSFRTATDTVGSSIDRTITQARDVIDASQDLCTAKCDLVRQTVELSDVGLNLAGASGNISIDRFVPRAELERQERQEFLTAQGAIAQAAFDAYLDDNDLTGNRARHKAIFQRMNPEFRGVPFLADGGIATGPTLAVIGEEENEFVLPFSRIPEVMPRIAEAASGPPARSAGDDARLARVEDELRDVKDQLAESHKEQRETRRLLSRLVSAAERGIPLQMSRQAAGEIVSVGDSSNARRRR